MPSPPITRVALYVRDIPKIASFYEGHFGFRRQVVATDKTILFPIADGCALVLFQASKGHRIGQSCVKLIFDVPDVRAFKAAELKKGLKFGIVHQARGYEFSNARDPAKNLIQISSAYLYDGEID